MKKKIEFILMVNSLCKMFSKKSHKSMMTNNFTNIIALVNVKSGSGKGLKILNEFKKIENCFAINILNYDEMELLTLFDKYKDICVILAGGDGTISLGFDILNNLLEKRVPVAFLPIGTGNELCGCTGWSNSHNGRNMEKYITQVQNGQVSFIDIWNIKYIDNEGIDHSIIRNNIMASFLGIGFDANITENFHQKRDSKKKQPSIITSKLSYINLGIKEMFNQSKYINDYIKIYANGKQIIIPKNIRCLQILNINSIANCINLFGNGKSNKNDLLQEGQYSSPKLNDGLLEIVGTQSIHHMNCMRLNIDHSIRLAQSSKITIQILTPLSVQIDGESWLNPKGSIEISCLGKWSFIQGPHNNASTRRGI